MNTLCEVCGEPARDHFTRLCDVHYAEALDRVRKSLHKRTSKGSPIPGTKRPAATPAT